MELKKLSRVFEYAGMRLPDPDVSFSPDQAAEAFVALYPELNNCDVQGPEVQGDNLVYKLVRAVGRKGTEDDTEVEETPVELTDTLVISQCERFFAPAQVFLRQRPAEESPAPMEPVTVL